jgi:PAS domain S-box-containing protein
MIAPIIPTPGSVRARFWAALVALAATVVTVVALTEYQHSTHEWVEHTRLVFQTTRTALLDIASTEVRFSEQVHDSAGGGAVRVDPLVAATALARLDSVIAMTADNLSQNTHIRRIREMAAQWATAVTDTSRANDAAAAALQAALVGLSDDFIGTETALYDARLTTFQRAQKITLVVIVLEMLFVAFVLFGYSRKIDTQFAALDEQHHVLLDQSAKLQEQAVELEVSNQELFEAVVTAEQETRGSARANAILVASLDNAPLAFALFDQDLRFVRVNARWADLAGISAAEHLDHTLVERSFSADALDDTLALLRRAHHDGAVTENVELSGHPASNPKDICHWLVSCAPVTLADGEIIGVAVTLLDVTDRNRLSDQLLHAQKMEAVGRLAGGIAHDFNNSLAVINAYTSMLGMSDGISTEDREHVKEISDAVGRAASLTRQLLAFGRRQITQPRVVDLNEVAQHMVPMITRLIPATIALSTRFEADPSTVSIDPSQLEQLLMNLVSNATHAMPDGGTLTIETDTRDLDEFYAQQHSGVTPGRYVTLTISDNGVGMDEETLRRIFEPFFTTKESGRGTGLGLASAYSIARGAGGHIWCYSEPGNGTTFKIYLPWTRPVVTSTESTPLSTGHRENVSILVVEDDEQLRPAITAMLERSGHRVRQASNGDAALAILADARSDIELVITDLVMPGMSGREMSEIIATRYPGMPVLFTSGYTDDLVTRRGMIELGWPFVQKPFTREQLRAGIERALSGT